MKKKKILFLGRFAPPMHGAARMNELYFNALKRDEKFLVEKIKLNSYNSLEEIGDKSFKKIICYFKTYLELVSKFKKFKPEVVYIEMAPRGAAFLKDSVYVLISKMFRKKILIQFHAKGARQTTKNKFLEKYYRLVLKNVKIILLSDLLFMDISNVAVKSQILILSNGIPDEINDKKFKKIIEKRKKNKKPQLLFLSNMIESKGPLDVLNICNELRKEGKDFECSFVGKFQDKKFQEKFEKQLKDFNLEKNCKYLGAKYGKDKRKILETTDFMVFPTKYENECFPLVILEAFMYGIPVLSYDNGAIKEIISEGYLGFVTKKGDWESLANELRRRLKGKEKTKKIREEFKKNYDLYKSEENFLRKIK